MEPVITLIDKAKEKCGTYTEVARRIGTSCASISSMRAGKREISPETAAMLAAIAQEDVRDAVVQAILDRNRNRVGPKAAKIREVLGKTLVL